MNYEHKNEAIFSAARSGDLEKIRQTAESGINLSSIPERVVINSSRGYVSEVDPSERRETNDFRYGFTSEPHSTDRTTVIFTESLLDCAVTSGNKELVRYMIDMGCDAVKSRALYIAVEAKDMELIKLLVEAQAEPCRQVYNKFPEHEEAFWYEGVKLKSPLELATETEQEETVEYFLGGNGNLNTENVSAAFMMAVSSENKTILKSFLSRWEFFGEEVFSKAAEKIICKSNPELNRVFLTCGAKVDPFSRCLAYALRTADTEAVKLIMAQGIRPWTAADWKSEFSENRHEESRFEGWGRIRKNSRGASEAYYHNKAESLNFDDDFKYISWTRRGGANNFSGYYGAAKQAPFEKRKEMIKVLAEEKLLNKDELSYLYYLAALGDDILLAEMLEDMGASVTDFGAFSRMSDSDKQIRSFSDMAQAQMSREKIDFICRHLREDETIVFGNNYFDPLYDRTDMLLKALDYIEKVHIVDVDKAISYFYQKDSFEGIEKMARIGALTAENTAHYVERSARDGKTEITAWFMDYRNKNFIKTEKDEDDESDMWEL